MRRAALLGAAGRYRILQSGPTLGGTGVGTVPSVPGGAINVKNAPYNATGNGTTDDGPAIRSAITAAGVNGTVYLPTGTYRYVATSTISANGTKMQGAGPTNSIILYESAAYIPFVYNTGDNVSFHSLQIKRNASVSLVMFLPQAKAGLTFDNCILDGNFAIGAQTDNHCFQLGTAAGTTLNTSFLNSTFKNWQFPLFQASPATATTDGFVVRNCFFTNNHLTDLEFNAPSSLMQNILVENNTFDTNFGPPAGGFGVGLANCHNAVVQYNLFRDHQQEGVHVEDRSSNIEIAYNQFIQCAQDRYSVVQIVSNSTDVRVRHNVVDGTGTKSVEYISAISALGGGGANPSNILIDDNTIDRGTNQGIYHQSVGITVTNNRFTPSVNIINGGSSGTITVTNNTVSTAYPANFPGTGGGGGGGGSAPTISSVTTRASAGVINVTASVGDTLVACVGAENSTPTISGAVTWTTRATGTGAGYPHNVKIFTGPVTTGGTQAITIGGSGTVDAVVYALAGGVTVDATAAGGASGATSQAVSGMTTTTANTLLLGVWGTQFGAATPTANYTPPAGMTEQADLPSADFALLGSFSEVLTSAGAVSRTATASHAGLGWSGALIALVSLTTTAVELVVMQEAFHDGGDYLQELTDDGVIQVGSLKGQLTAGEQAYIAGHHQFFGYFCFPHELIRDAVDFYVQSVDPNYAATMAGLVAAYGINNMYMRGMVEFDNDPANTGWAQNRFSEAGVGGARPDIPTGLTRQQAHDQFLHFYQAADHGGNTNHHQLGTFVNPSYTTRGYKVMVDPVNAAGCQYAFEMGADLVTVQTANDDISGIIGKVAFVRGSARQAGGKPYGIDLSASRSAAPLSGSITYAAGVLTAGWSAPYMRRHCYITWACGSRVLANEGVDYTVGPASGQTYNPHGLMMQGFTTFANANPTAGTPHVPFALVKDHNSFFEPCYGQFNQSRAVWYFTMSPNAGEHMLFSLWDVIYPGAKTAGSSTTTAEPMGTSRYGEAFDVITDTSTTSVFGNYRTVIWASNNTLTNTQVDALTAYANTGGVVVVNAKQLTGTYHQTLTGITLGSTAAGASGTITWDSDSTTTTAPTFDYTTLTLGAATRAARLSTSTNMITKNVVGSGECWVVAADWMSRQDNTVILPVVTKLLDILADRVAPATVTGTAVEWLVNTKPTSTIVTVVNTAASAASVTVSWPQPASSYTTTELIVNTLVSNSLSDGRVSISPTVSAGDVKVYSLNF